MALLLPPARPRNVCRPMGNFLFYYQRPEPATWVYMSSFLIVGIYFMFHRVWSIRNLDIVLLLLFTPGIMLIHESYRLQVRQLSGGSPTATTQAAENSGAITTTPIKLGKLTAAVVDADAIDSEQATWSPRGIRLFGYVWLLSICALWLIRMLIDTTFFRRPMLEPNLSRGGLIFIGLSLFAFLTANIFNGPPSGIVGAQLNRGPGFNPLKALPDIATSAAASEYQNADFNHAMLKLANRPQSGTLSDVEEMKQVRLTTVSRILLVIANTVLVLGIVAIGFWHFSDLRIGVGAAAMYLLLPYAAQMIGRVEHAIPGAFLVLAVLLYRRPFFSGTIIGFAGGLVFYPFFLLPLWLSFYWQRGQRRFIAGVLISVVGLIITLASVSDQNFVVQVRQMFGTISFQFDNLDGIWGLGLHPYIRIPVVVAFVVLAFSFALWPAQKSLATLLNGSAAIMVASQFCYAFGGGLLMAWYLPLVLLTVFRPNLDDLVASQAVRPFRFSKRREPPARVSLYSDAG